MSRHVLDHATLMSMASYTLLRQPHSLQCISSTQFALIRLSLAFGHLVPVAVSDDTCQEIMGLYAGLAATLIVLAFSSAGSAFVRVCL